MNNWIRLACIVGALGFSDSLHVGIAQDADSYFTADRSGSPKVIEPSHRRSEDERVIERRRELMQDFRDETTLDHGQSINPELMQSVKDNTLGVRYQEREAYLRILRLASEVPLHRQQRFAADIQAERRSLNPAYSRRRPDEFPQFVDLFTHPDAYRGRAVTLHGVMRKLTKFDLGKNALGLEQAYEGWVFTDDCQGNPAVVVFTSKDDRLRVSGDIQEEVRFTGYAFKMYGYDAQDVVRKAPLILAGEVEWVPHPYQSSYKILGIEWYGLATLVFALGCYVVWHTNRREMPPRPPVQMQPDFTHIPPHEHPGPDPILPHSISETEDS